MFPSKLFFCHIFGPRGVKCSFILAIWLALIGAIYLRNCTIFFPSFWEILLKNNYFYFKAWFKKPTKLEENERQLLQLKANIPQKRENNWLKVWLPKQIRKYEPEPQSNGLLEEFDATFHMKDRRRLREW